MQSTYEHMVDLRIGDELAPEDTRNVPFMGFLAGSLVSLEIWAVIAWAVWVVVT